MKLLNSKKEKYRKHLIKYVHEEHVDYVVNLLLKYPTYFRISKPRKTKLGDFRANYKNSLHSISINGNLNKYSFLITTIHEFAHLVTYNEHKWKVKPHGKEWQVNYTKLILPIVESGTLPEDLHKVLLNSLYNVKASSCSDKNLYRVLLSYDELDDGLNYLEKLDHDSLFELNGRFFKKGNLRRTRFVCMEDHTQKIYLVNALAKVKEIKNEK